MGHQLKIRELSLQYSSSEPKALSTLSLEVGAGTCCAILGPTGAGKSTLLHCIAGTLRRHHPESISSGRVTIGTTEFDGIPEHILFPISGLVLQDPYVQISGVRDTVYEEILFTLENLGTLPKDSRTSIESLLHELGIGHLAGRKPTSLSGGETQRVALAAIMIAKPQILLLDEPTTALDSAAQDKLRRILHTLRGRTTVLVTDSSLDFALSVAEKVVVLDRGSVCFNGNRASFVRQLEEFSAILPVSGWVKAKRSLSSHAGSGHSKLVQKVLGME
jgi:energy-coupling factor transporter ATP-binding protein EcfA2